MTLNDWFDINGRRFMELKLAGGEKLIKDPENCEHNLTLTEMAEFHRYLGQIEALLWILQPFENKEFRQDIKKFFKQAEKEHKIIINTPRGYA